MSITRFSPILSFQESAVWADVPLKALVTKKLKVAIECYKQINLTLINIVTDGIWEENMCACVCIKYEN